MCTATLTSSFFACGSNVTCTYVESTGTLTISGTGDMYSYSNVSNRPWHNYLIKKVVINNGVTSIGDWAFSDCTGLTSVTIGNGVTSIGSSAFWGCTGLTSINVAEDNLNYASIDGVLYSKDKKTLIKCPDGKTGSVTIPNSVTSIGEGAFAGCSGLTSITIPNSVTSIGNWAFAGCTGLTSVTIPNSVTYIGGGAFEGCSGLTSITIPNSVTYIGMGAFSYCTGLTSITIPNSVTSIGSDAFSYCRRLTRITIPNSVTSIGSDAFSYCRRLTRITIPNSVTSIGRGAFSHCTRLTSVTIPNRVTSIGDDAFKFCTGLTSVTIPNCVTYIGGKAFYGCTGLTSMTVEATNPPYYLSTDNIVSNYSIPLYVPAGSVDAYKAADEWKKFTNIRAADDSGSCGENVTYSFVSSTGTLTISGTGDMNDYDFESSQAPWYYLSIKKVVINNGVTSIGDWAFSDCTGLTSVTIGNGVTSIGSSAFYGCKGLTSINVAEDNLNYASIDGVLYSKDKKTLIECPEGKTGSITIPNSVTSIGEGAFAGCSGLTSVTIPNSVTSIAAEAFSECTGLKSVTIPNSVTSIGEYAFGGCTGLTSVTIPNSVTSIGDGAFYECKGLTSMTVEATNPPSSANIVLDYDIPLYVPAGSVDAYKAADEWKKFTNIQAIPATGVNEATAEKSEVKKVIDRNGIIYIEKDGTRYFLNGDKVE